MPKIVIATRGSQLALWQANHVKDRLQALEPDLAVELAVIKTRGDKILDVPLGCGLLEPEEGLRVVLGDALAFVEHLAQAELGVGLARIGLLEMEAHGREAMERYP